MRNCGSIIETEIERQRIKRQDISAYIGFSAQNLSRVLKKESMDSAMLEKFCEYLRLDPADFFDYRPEYLGSGVKVGDIRQRVGIGDASVSIGRDEALQQLLAEKDARIRALELALNVYERLNETISRTSNSMDK